MLRSHIVRGQISADTPAVARIQSYVQHTHANETKVPLCYLLANLIIELNNDVFEIPQPKLYANRIEPFPFAQLNLVVKRVFLKYHVQTVILKITLGSPLLDTSRKYMTPKSPHQNSTTLIPLTQSICPGQS